MKKTILRPVIGIVSAVLAFYLLFGNPLVLLHTRQMNQALSALPEGTVTMEEALPFRWDKLYTFSPYTTVEEMEQVMGCSSHNLKPSVSEGMVQVVAVGNGAVLAAECAYPDAIGYVLTFDSPLSCGENTLFTVSHDAEGLVTITPADSQ